MENTNIYYIQKILHQMNIIVENLFICCQVKIDTLMLASKHWHWDSRGADNKGDCWIHAVLSVVMGTDIFAWMSASQITREDFYVHFLQHV